MKKANEHIDEILMLRIIENRADDNEIKLFNNWLQASEMHAKEFEQFKKVYELASVNTLNKQKNWQAIMQKVSENQKVPDYIELEAKQHSAIKLYFNRYMRYAAIFLLVLGLGFLTKTIVFDSQQLTISGKDMKLHEAYTLADGSKVYLSGNSEISFSKNFGKKEREIILKGEAFFEVQRNEKLPFTITTNKTTTQVLGTSFNVFSDLSGNVKVSVVSGLVSFYASKKDEGLKLKAGEQGKYNPVLQKIERDKNTDMNQFAWKTGILYFNETPVTEAFDLLQKHYSCVFVFKNQQKNIPTLTTTFDNQKLEAVLDELNLLFNTKNVTRNDTIYFIPNIK